MQSEVLPALLNCTELKALSLAMGDPALHGLGDGDAGA
jgi:hypothetical protein